MCRDKCNANPNCTSFMHEPFLMRCFLMFMPINGLQQNHMEFGAFKNCSLLLDPCVSTGNIICIKRETIVNWKILEIMLTHDERMNELMKYLFP